MSKRAGHFTRNAGNVLGRMHAKGMLVRAVRGVYYVPERSALMGAEVPASADEQAIRFDTG